MHFLSAINPQYITAPRCLINASVLHCSTLPFIWVVMPALKVKHGDGQNMDISKQKGGGLSIKTLQGSFTYKSSIRSYF